MRKSVKIFWKFFFFCCFLFIGFLIAVNFGLLGKMPSIKELENPSILQASEVFADDGTLMGKYYLPDGNRSVIQYRQLSKHLLNALIATEDKRFTEHSGIDFRGTFRALFLLGRKGGGSTITQQLALALFNRRASNKALRVIQKLKEWIIAVKLERNFTKEEILALYLNAVAYSENEYGIRNASLTFYQKEPKDLNVQEAAMMIGMLNAPGLYNPRKNPKAATDRRNLVLTRMVESNYLSFAHGEKLKASPLGLKYKKINENTGYAPYFREVLRDELKKIVKELKKPNGESYNIYDDGLRVYTTISPKMQEYAEQAVAERMAALQRQVNSLPYMKNGNVWKKHENIIETAMKKTDRWRQMEEDGLSEKQIRASFFEEVPMAVFAWNKARSKDTVMTPYDSIRYHKQMEQAAFMAMDPITGEVKAWVGGIGFKWFKYDHVNVKTQRQVGSTIKPLLYAQAMEERGFTEKTPCNNVAQYFSGYGYVPDGKRCGGGSVAMANALAKSLNCVSAYLMKQVGPAHFVDFLHNINIPTKLAPYPSVCLGSCDLSLYEMLWAYTIFIGKGFSSKPYMISRIEDRNGNVIKRFDFAVNRKEALSEATAYRMCRMMQGTVDYGTARGLRAEIGVKEMGGKTGTTNDNADAWFIGYTPQLLAGAWVGFDDRFLKNTGDGNRIASPIFRSFFKKALNDKKLGLDSEAQFIKPTDMELEENSADIYVEEAEVTPGAQGTDQGNGSEKDYIMEEDEKLGGESTPYQDIEKKIPPAPIETPQKDTTTKTVEVKKTDEKPPAETKKEEPKQKKKLLEFLKKKKK